MKWFIGITIVTLASGWVGAAINELLGQPQSADSLGSLIWLATPFVLVVVARVTKQVSAPGRWNPRLKQSWPWYVLALFACGVMVLWGVLFAELFRLAGSIWPLVLLHAVEDVTVNPLVLEGRLVIRPGFEWLISPVVGILPALCLCGLGFVLRWYRVNRVRGSEISPRSSSLPGVSEPVKQGAAV